MNPKLLLIMMNCLMSSPLNLEELCVRELCVGVFREVRKTIVIHMKQIVKPVCPVRVVYYLFSSFPLFLKLDFRLSRRQGVS